MVFTKGLLFLFGPIIDKVVITDGILSTKASNSISLKIGIILS